MVIKELVLASALSLSPETLGAGEQKTVSDKLSSCKNTIHQVMESKEDSKKLDDKLIELATLISKNNPISMEFGYKVASNGQENYKELLIDDILNQVKKNSAFKEIPEDEREDFLTDLDLVISGYDEEGVKDVLNGYDFPEKFINLILKKIPTKPAGIPEITTEELKNLATLNFRDVIETYIDTGKIPKGFESFEEGLKEIKTIIKKGEEADKRGKEADRKAKKAKEIEEKINGLIKEMEKLKLKLNSGTA